MEMLWRFSEIAGLAIFVVGLLATAIIHTVGYIRFQLAQLKAEKKAITTPKN